MLNCMLSFVAAIPGRAYLFSLREILLLTCCYYLLTECEDMYIVLRINCSLQSPRQDVLIIQT